MDTADDPTDALSVLADETRLAILRTLAEAEDPLSFSGLRERTGVRDSGRFGYHLRRLCEYFVRETQDGYELGHAGARLVDATGTAHDGRHVSDGGPIRDESRLGDSDSVTANDAKECPVCGETDCQKFFGVHLSPPWA